MNNSISQRRRYGPISRSNHLHVVFRFQRQLVVLVGVCTRIPEPRGDHVRRREGRRGDLLISQLGNTFGSSAMPASVKRVQERGNICRSVLPASTFHHQVMLFTRACAKALWSGQLVASVGRPLR